MKKIFGLIVICFIIAIVSGCAVSADSQSFGGPEVIYSSGTVFRDVTTSGSSDQMVVASVLEDTAEQRNATPFWPGTTSVLTGSERVPVDAEAYIWPKGACGKLPKGSKMPVLGKNAKYYLLENGQFIETGEKPALGCLCSGYKELRGNYALVQAHLMGPNEETVYADRWIEICQ
ncbi:hypothetical protein COY33_00045 [candidate division WWE3 bacterium CG_4_10_14_0_2_um_filter_42_7]|uniref:Uncharacterized protein n=2 Tax=Katanobacteria TaxID=422282 RepID=A0A2H0X8I9_UNCKA|nr:MAG: hypothetical protein COT51_03865 [candidate division WWE3 bacterium CG08_land_8_20_14_0_20_41_15]PIZ44259.1 MAG: hypothetical protein COY33_00045 [candidate division WWE3 bacterium CG_4_10_14_0_2_um_filter_42_7]